MSEEKKKQAITIDLSALTLGDVEILESPPPGTPLKKLLDILDKAVVGDVREIKMDMLPDVMAALRDAFNELRTPLVPGEVEGEGGSKK